MAQARGAIHEQSFRYLPRMSHGVNHHPAELAEAASAAEVARVMLALSAPSRLRLLACLHEGPGSVTELSRKIGMEQSAVSHQLRVLREQGLVVGDRNGRLVTYSLHDEHVGQLLIEAMSHGAHQRLGLAESLVDREAITR